MDLKFGNIIKKTIQLFKKNIEIPNVVYGVDIGTSSVKVVQLRRRDNRIELETYGIVALGPYSGSSISSIVNLTEEKIALAVSDVFREANITTKYGSVSVASESSMVFLLELPGNTNPESYKSIVETEAKKYIPLSLSEVSLDFFPIPTEQKSQTNTTTIERPKKLILVAALYNDTINKYQNIAKISEIGHDFLEIECFSVVRSCFSNSLKSGMVIDLGASRTKIYIVEDGIIMHSHIINRGQASITTSISNALEIPYEQAEIQKRNSGFKSKENLVVYDIIKLSFEYIMNEVSVVLRNYNSKYKIKVDKIILVGGGANLKGVTGFITEKTGIEAVVANPFSRVNYPTFMSEQLKKIGPDFSGALGVAMHLICD